MNRDRPGLPLSEIECLAAQLGDVIDALTAVGDERLQGVIGDVEWVQKRLHACVDPETGEARK